MFYKKFMNFLFSCHFRQLQISLHTLYMNAVMSRCDGLEHDSLSFHNFIAAQSAGTANSDIVPFCLNDRKIYIQLNKLQ